MVAGNHADVQGLKALSPLLIERSEVDLQLRAMASDWKADMDAMRAWAASDEIMRKMQLAQTETVRRLNGMESIVACKLDRSEVAYLESLANNFESFAEFQKSVCSSLDILDGTSAKLANQLAETKLATEALRLVADNTCLKLSMMTTKSETRALAKELERQQEIMKGFCVLDTVDDVWAHLSCIFLYMVLQNIFLYILLQCIIVCMPVELPPDVVGRAPT